MALGATAGQVQLGVIAQTLRLALVGVGIGSAASLAVGRGIASLLFGTEPTDPTIFTAVIALLGSVAVVAGHIPARRASRIDPVEVLRGV
jgi:ABC-type antimicrobial peptide transport system permease subunit